jgi:LmbE family N-acetylglucosaminyl deacetylase
MSSGNQLTLMAVHAHPDDESSSTGGVLARYAAEGVRTVLVTCTNGEYGDGPNHAKPGEVGHDPEQVAKVRLGELAQACEILNVTHGEVLGYSDSGMADWDYKDGSEVFCQIPLEVSTGRLVALMEQYQPDVVITYDNMAAYNHPDHLRAHEITVAAAEATHIPKKLYFIARRRRDWEKMRERLEAAGIETPAFPPRQLTPEQEQQMAVQERRITTEVHTADWAPQKREALAAHASQLDGSIWLQFPPEMFAEVFDTETFILASDSTHSPVPETDLFVGLR